MEYREVRESLVAGRSWISFVSKKYNNRRRTIGVWMEEQKIDDKTMVKICMGVKGLPCLVDPDDISNVKRIKIEEVIGFINNIYMAEFLHNY